MVAPTAAAEPSASRPASVASHRMLPLVGRDAELELAVRTVLLPDVRLLTLTGPGGVGKTRLAVEVAATARSQFEDGAQLLDLSPYPVGTSVPGLLARLFDVVPGDTTTVDAVVEFLGPREILLVLDNCEHLAEVAGVVAELSARCPGLTVLATSRAPLGLTWEHRLTVPPLPIPPAAGPYTVATLTAIASVALFVARAQAADPGFRLDESNAGDVAELCERLDGLPLALELAAARVTVLTPAQMVARLDRHLPLPGGDSVDRPERHRSLYAMIAWSVDLLTPPARTLLQVCAQFTGSFALGAAEAVVPAVRPEPMDVLTGLGTLVDQSLVERAPAVDDEPRFRLLRTIGDFARETVPGDVAAVAARAHAGHYADLATTVAPLLRGVDQERWARRLTADGDNIRQALTWLTEHDGARAGTMAAALGRYWWMSGRVDEGYRWLERTIDQLANAPVHVQATALGMIGDLALWQGNVEDGRRWLTRQLALARARGLPDAEAWARLNLGVAAALTDDLVAARTELKRAVDRARQHGDSWMEIMALRDYGWVLRMSGDPFAAERVQRTAAERMSAVGDVRGLAVVQVNLAETCRDLGRPDDARTLLRDTLRAGARLHDQRIIGFTVDVLCTVVAAPTEPVARLLGAADTAYRSAGMPVDSSRLRSRDRVRKALVDALTVDVFDAAWAEGSTLALTDVVATAMALLGDAAPPAVPDGGDPAEPNLLSPREMQVLTLVAEGMPNKRIARSLGISERTVKAHLTTAFQKLGVYTRGHAALVARERGFIGR